jgi:very-short-patch-repair endonuclease
VLKGDRQLVLRARKLRKEMSLPEGLLWRELKLRPGGIKFRKQHPGGFYVLDFYCPDAKLCIEVDGEAHSMGDQPEFDAKRDAWLKLHGIMTLRIPAVDVLRNLECVLIHIVETARSRIPPRGGEEAAGTADGGAVTW